MPRGLAPTIVAIAAALALGGARPPPRDLPLTLVDSFDRAWSMASHAAEERMAEIERRCEEPVPPPAVSLEALLDRTERQVTADDDAARRDLDRTLAKAPALSAGRRAAVLDCIERHLGEASRDLSSAIDERDDELARLEIAELRATVTRLRAVRALVLV